MLTAIALATERIGVIATASTSYNDPYNLARRLGSLDHLSGGRAAWNIVTTAGDAAARNFGLTGAPVHDDRYGRAEEFVDIAVKLWDSWEDDAILADRARGVFGDRAKVHTIDHEGTHFAVRGPLNIPRSPQGRPVLVQAGSSEHGKALAARRADAVFTAQTTLEDGQAFYAEMKARAAAFGRDPDSLKIMLGLTEPTSLRAARQPGRFDPTLPANAAKLAAVEQLAALAQEAGLSLIHLALAFVLEHPAISSAIIGPRTLEHLESQLGAEKVSLSQDVLDRIDEIVPPGAVLNQADAGYQPPSITDPAQRRRQGVTPAR